jgi:hypothetical protein
VSRTLGRHGIRSAPSATSVVGALAAALLLGLAAGCSTATAPTTAPSRGHHHAATTTTGAPTTTTTSTPPVTTAANTAPPEQASTVQVQINGATTIVTFDSSDLSGTLQTANPGFNASGTTFTFTISGVSYSGTPVTTTAAGTGLISQVVVSGTSGGASVVVSLRSAASHDEFGLGRDTVGVSLS